MIDIGRCIKKCLEEGKGLMILTTIHFPFRIVIEESFLYDYLCRYKSEFWSTLIYVYINRTHIDVNIPFSKSIILYVYKVLAIYNLCLKI